MASRAADRAWAWVATGAGLLLLPVGHFAAVDLEPKTADAPYLRQVADRYVSTSLGGGLGLLVVIGLIYFLLGLRRAVVPERPLLADTCTAVGSLAVVGWAVGFASSIMAAYGAHEHYPFAAVRPMGLLAENLGPVLLPTLAGPALLVAAAALRDRLFPKWVGYVSAVFAVVLALLGVLVPGAGALPALLWLVVAGGGIAFSHTEAAAAR